MELSTAMNLFLGEQTVNTRNSYKYVLRAMSDFIGGAKPLDIIKSTHTLEYIHSLKQRETIKSPATYNKHIKTINVFFNWCVKMGYIEENPAKGIKRKKIHKTPDKSKAMPHKTYQTLLEYTRYKPRAHALALFLGDTGCRIGGAAALLWSDVNFDTLTATVQEKGQAPRPVFFGTECKQALLTWNLKQKRTKGNHVFSFRGNRINNNSLGLYFEKQVKKAGITQAWGPHSLRHRKGHQLADNATPPTIAAQVLGHSNVTTTLEHYYPRDWQRAEEEARQLHTKNAPKIFPKVEDL